MPPHRPGTLPVYTGDNDSGDDYTAKKIMLFFDHLRAAVAAALGTVPVRFVSIKPDPAAPARPHRVRQRLHCPAGSSGGAPTTSSTATTGC